MNNSDSGRDVLSLPEDELEQLKNRLIDDGKIITKAPKSYDKKFFQAVLTSAKVIKRCLFLCFALYALLNLSGIILSIVYKHFTIAKLVSQTLGCLAVSFVCIVIFNNINTNKKIERDKLYIDGGNFIFNFNNGIVETPDIFYCLPCESLLSIAYEIHGTAKREVYGKVVFTFEVSGYKVRHIINSLNITELEDYLLQTYPKLADKIIGDAPTGGSKNGKLSCYLCALGCTVAAALLTVIPLLLNYFNLALIIAGGLLLLTAAVILAFPRLKTRSLQQGLVVSAIFIIIGYLVPLFIILNGKPPFIEFLAANSLLLLVTFLGNIGLIIYAYILCLSVNKLCYLIRRTNGF